MGTERQYNLRRDRSFDDVPIHAGKPPEDFLLTVVPLKNVSAFLTQRALCRGAFHCARQRFATGFMSRQKNGSITFLMG
jgi:hypothetical protein